MHLPINLAVVFLSREAFEERNENHWSEGQVLVERAATWP